MKIIAPVSIAILIVGVVIMSIILGYLAEVSQVQAQDIKRGYQATIDQLRYEYGRDLFNDQLEAMTTPGAP